jgi:hypothetical protein
MDSRYNDEKGYKLIKINVNSITNMSRSVSITSEILHPYLVPTLVDTVHFWSRQLMEHCFFLYLGLDDQFELKTKMYNEYKKWYSFVMDNFGQIDSNKNNEQLALPLTPDEIQQFTEPIPKIEVVKGMIIPLREYHVEILKLLKTGKWIGTLQYSFVKHILSELEFFNLKIEGDRVNTYFEDAEEAFEEAKQDDIFWTDINGDHAGAISQLLDTQYILAANTDVDRTPVKNDIDFKNEKGYDLISELEHPVASLQEFQSVFASLVFQLKKLGDVNPEDAYTLYVLSIKRAEELDIFFQSLRENITAVGNGEAIIKSIIHPVLLNHIIREGIKSKAAISASISS